MKKKVCTKKDQAACLTGLPGLDAALKGVRLGDNVVFQVNTIDDYVRFVHPFCKKAYEEKRKLIYFRFAEHSSLLPAGIKADIYQLHPEVGFEDFLSEIFDIIEKSGKGAFYVFDSLSELAVDWHSDRMLGNFFMLTCPYLFDLDTVAYFALLRDHHTSLAIKAIHKTAQVVMDIYNHKEEIYVHPLKVDERHSQTMYMLHKWQEGCFVPVVKSAITAEILGAVPQAWLDFTMQQRDMWTRSFLQAQEVVNTTRSDRRETWKSSKLFERLLRMAVTRDERLLKLATEYFDFEDVVNIGKRMIGTGLIGGKSVGMLLARAILKKNSPKLVEKLEQHDSFYLGSDVFYTYLIENKCWWLRRKLNSSASGFESASKVKTLILKGKFPKDIQDQFMEMLEYFGQSPIIVRSSSLLEDAYGNSFSGKYESVFCANQGTPEDRLEKFMEAVRHVYASTMNEEALAYRGHWGLLDQDEQMALLIQRVSGAVYEDQYFPQLAGVGFSFNPYVWNSQIDPKAGMLRLVFGLGTRAVDRTDDDYTRLVALNAPMLWPDASSSEIQKYTQRKVDVLDLSANKLCSRSFEDIAKKDLDLPLDIFASRDEDLERRASDMGREDIFSRVLTFDKLLSKTPFVEDMRQMMETLQASYQHAVDIEFTANFFEGDEYKINLLQCRPFQVKGNILSIETPQSIARDKIILETRGPVIGSSLATTIDRLIYVVPEIYSKMNTTDRYSVARLIGQINHISQKGKKPSVMLVGPGRWATTTPALGVPVSFAEINNVSVLCEIAEMHEGLVPDVSLGTHFFNDLVEMDMLYFVVYPQKYDNVLNREYFSKIPNDLTKLISDAAKWESVVRVVDSRYSGKKMSVCLSADVLKQNVICYLEDMASPKKKE
ncbi:MAG: PEP/pyruvate-binding domain-containing protein [Candidatus Omnitrophota bacterium]